MRPPSIFSGVSFRLLLLRSGFLICYSYELTHQTPKQVQPVAPVQEKRKDPFRGSFRGDSAKNWRRGSKLFLCGTNTPRRDFYRDTAKSPSKRTKKQAKNLEKTPFSGWFLLVFRGFFVRFHNKKIMNFKCIILTLANSVLVVKNRSKLLAFKVWNFFLEVLDVRL